MSARDTMATLCAIPAAMVFEDDLHQENGGYVSECTTCHQAFMGLKGRAHCPVCCCRHKARWNALTPEEQEEWMKRRLREAREWQEQHDMSGYKPPFLRDGAHYGTDHNGREVSRGARMGRSTRVDASRYDGSKLRLVQVAVDSQGYDLGGAYWGHGREPLWCAFVQGGAIEIFTHAKDRYKAKKNVRAVLCSNWGAKPMPPIDFYR